LSNYLANFHSQITGPETGPKLVFLHGVMGFALNFRRIAKAFENEYQVLVYDQRGHGRSFHPTHGYGPEDYAGDLAKILDELGWEKIRLVGHSMGGRAALRFASDYPERLTQLVIEDIGPSMANQRESLVTKMIDATPVPFASKKEAKAWFDHDFMELFKEQRKVAGLSAYLYSNITENEQKQAVFRFYEPGIRESVALGRDPQREIEGWKQIESLMVDTLLIRGEFSQDLPRETYDRILAINSRIEGVEIAESGHWVHSDQPDIFIEQLRSFFDKKQGNR
jgi:esterase